MYSNHYHTSVEMDVGNHLKLSWHSQSHKGQRRIPTTFGGQRYLHPQTRLLPTHNRGTSLCPQGMKRKAEGMAQPTSTTPLPTQSLAPAASPAAATREHFFPSLLSARLTD